MRRLRHEHGLICTGDLCALLHHSSDQIAADLKPVSISQLVKAIDALACCVQIGSVCGDVAQIIGTALHHDVEMVA